MYIRLYSILYNVFRGEKKILAIFWEQKTSFEEIF